ncbi:Carboxypeptidase regulatory-like domain-containing protein [Asanoa hainanensis]|uniref:Carboxypeptidase regulatory-like domain-containing protein n=1 Tax=Asanoa hainanensis TaxID=560556 RepID=A0A239MV58_9ACTN|nr:carboxypeptidase-like regulatory domain-containing protein [Asanoa hainanensis]SNT46123.1 Carboxypeptidase regulatory-like domain-containing protein [Asanoa hainanensis]
MRRVRATAALAAVALAGTLAVWATPAQAADTGVISGRVTTSDGAPAADVFVAVLDFENWGDPVGYTTTAADGTYSVGGLATDGYIVSMSGGDNPTQYFDGKTDIFDANEVRVTTGQTTTVNPRLVPAGFIVGRVLQADGEPLTSTWISITNENGVSVGGAGTDDNGDYRAAVPAGTYFASFTPVAGGLQDQFIPGKLGPDDATRITVTAGQETRADDTALRVGNLSGRLTNDDGTPVREAYVYVSPFQANGNGVNADTDANGEFSLPMMLVGTYMVEFNAGDRHQFFDGALEPNDADPVTVTAGQDTRVVESMLPTGTVRVRAVDAISGIAIRDFCAESFCSNGTGQVLMTDQAIGTRAIGVYAQGNYLSRDSNVTVRANQTTDVVARLLPGAKITTTVVDKATGQPLPNVCVFAYKPAQVYTPDNYGGDQCSDTAGKVTLDKLAAGPYRLFAQPRNNNTYGKQWVAANGGTGDERLAATITTTTGKTTAAPQVKLDRAGSIRGRVTDAATGAPLAAQIALFTSSPGAGGPETYTDADGRFQIDGLGPYAWPLRYSSDGYATTWTGGAASRFAATGTQVTTGTVATADLALTRGVAVRGTVVTSHGTPRWGRVNAYNAETGDLAGTVDFAGTAFQLNVLSGQELRFEYSLDINGLSYRSDKAKLSPATPGGPPRYTVVVPAGGLTVDILAG